MSVRDIPTLPHDLLCQSPIYNDNRWDVRPQHFRRGKESDLEWINTPMQPPYMATDTPHMSYDLNKYKTPQGALKPEVAPDPCIPYHTKYCSFNRPAWEYDHSTPSLVLPKLPCKYRGKTTVPDIGCLDQQGIMNRDQLTNSLNYIHNT